jgi:type I restriction enzyme S subunit
VSLKPYPEYKDSGVEFLGQIPSHWSLPPAVELAGVLTSTVDKKTYENEIPVQLCNYTDVYYSDAICSSADYMRATASQDQIDAYSVRKGDVPFTKDSETSNDIGIGAYVERDLPGVVYGYHLSIYRPHDAKYGKYLKWLLDSKYVKATFEARTPGVTRVGLSRNTIRYLRVPTPAPPEAARISRFLDRETAEIDAFIADQEELIALLTERRRSALDDALAAIDSAPRIKLRYLFSPERVENMPNEEVLSVFRDFGVVPKSSRDGNHNKTPEDVSRYQLVRPGYLVVNRMKAWQGSLGVSSHRGIVSPDYEVLRPAGNSLLPQFAHHFLRSPKMVTQYAVNSTGIRPSQWRLYWDQLGMLSIPVPRHNLQKKLCERIDETNSEIDAAIADAREAIALSKERRAALISAAVTGKIDVRNHGGVE